METRPQANYDHDNDQFLVKTKPLVWRMTAQPYNRFVLRRGRGVFRVMETRLNWLNTNQVDKSKNIPADKVNVPYQ